MNIKYLLNIITNSEEDDWLSFLIDYIDEKRINNKNTVFVIDGCTGVGKSTRIKNLKDNRFDVMDTDNYFDKEAIKNNIKYTFYSEKILKDLDESLKTKSVIVVGIHSSIEFSKEYYKNINVVYLSNIIDEEFYNRFDCFYEPDEFINKNNRKSKHDIRKKVAELMNVEYIEISDSDILKIEKDDEVRRKIIFNNMLQHKVDFVYFRDII